MPIAHIALARPLYQLFDYQLTPEMAALAQIGMRVRVPFGQRQTIGIIVALDETCQVEQTRLKAVSQLLDEEPIFSPPVWQLLSWAADYYHYPLGEILFHALPVLLRQGRSAIASPVVRWQVTALGQAIDLNSLKRAPKQQQLLANFRKLTDKQTQPIDFDFSSAIYTQLKKQGLLEHVTYSLPPLSWREHYSVNPLPFSLNQQQQSAISQIIAELRQFTIWLLEGVTGSGKTEIYLNALAATLAEGKQALVLVPEIGLTPQTIARFKQRFNAPIDILHSALNDSERLKVWLRTARGENAIVVGTRSALFTPFKQLGIIIIDEEHDGSYKQQEGWRYHARDLAIVRAKLEQIPIILGSATPAIESINNVKNGKYRYLQLTNRAGEATLARQTLLDIRGLPLQAGLAPPLLHKISEHLAQQNQVMLFLNRRGFAPLLMCHDCGWIAECPRCDRPYTYHHKQKKLICHHCDTPRQIPLQCPKCGSTHLLPIGFGTEQLEQTLQAYFPDIPVTRIDRDSVTQKGSLEAYLAKINQGGAHILVGTQILAKGHHFADVTLVGLVDVDGALFSGDFRATERFAQIYTQVSGRAGREAKAGEVILQTRHPEHPLLLTLLDKGYQAFAEQALTERQLTNLPPFSFQVLLRAADRDNNRAPAFLQKIHHWLTTTYLDNALWLLGPMPANPPRRAGLNRWHLLIQHQNRQQLQHIIKHLVSQIARWEEGKQIRWSIDIDPIESY